MPDVVGKFLDTISLLIDPFLVFIATVCIVVGFIVGRHLRLVIRLILCGLALLAFFIWMQAFVFPYPPSAPHPSKRIISGTEYTPAAALLAKTPRYKGHSTTRLYGELVYAAGGDSENVWTGSSIERVKLLGNILMLLLAFAIGTLPRTKKEGEK